MGNSNSSPIQTCLLSAIGNNQSLVAFPDQPFYQLSSVKPYNLNIPLSPEAVTFPETSQQIADIVKCAVTHGYKVQARSGGHSYGNYGIYPSSNSYPEINTFNRSRWNGRHDHR